MKRLMIGLAAVMMTSAAWTQAPAQEAAPAGPYQCTLSINPISKGQTQVLTARFKSVEACKGWALDANHLDGSSGSYQLLVHDTDGRVVLHQACTVQGLPLLGSSRSRFDCKDVTA